MAPILARCRLCLREATLQDSHFIPKAAYRYLRMIGGLGNPNPTFLRKDKMVQTSHQMSDYLLCSACEQRFNARGEGWCLKHCDRGRGRFRLREILESHTPRWNIKGFRVYDGDSIPEIDTKALVYFGLSVFWRAAVHTWKTPKGTVAIELGPYEEPLRRFLLDEIPFPPKMVITVRVSDLGNMFWTPVEKNKSEFRIFAFGMLGLEFTFVTGSKIPPEFFALGTAPDFRKSIWRVQSRDNELFADMVSIYKAAASSAS